MGRKNAERSEEKCEQWGHGMGHPHIHDAPLSVPSPRDAGLRKLVSPVILKYCEHRSDIFEN